MAVRLRRRARRSAGASVDQDLDMSESEMIVTQTAVYACRNETVDPFDRLFLAVCMVEQVVHSHLDEPAAARFLIEADGLLAVKAAVVHAGHTVAEKYVVCSLEGFHEFLFCVNDFIPHVSACGLLEQACHASVFVDYDLSRCKHLRSGDAACFKRQCVVDSHVQTASRQLYRIVRSCFIELIAGRMSSLCELALLIAGSFDPCSFWSLCSCLADLFLYLPDARHVIAVAVDYHGCVLACHSQVHVRVDETRQQCAAAKVDDLCVFAFPHLDACIVSCIYDLVSFYSNGFAYGIFVIHSHNDAVSENHVGIH